MTAEKGWVNLQEDMTLQTFMAVAHGLYMNRYHLLTLTEVVRAGVKPNEDGALVLKTELDRDIREQAFNYLLAVFPEDLHLDLLQRKAEWTIPQ